MYCVLRDGGVGLQTYYITIICRGGKGGLPNLLQHCTWGTGVDKPARHTIVTDYLSNQMKINK